VAFVLFANIRDLSGPRPAQLFLSRIKRMNEFHEHLFCGVPTPDKDSIQQRFNAVEQLSAHALAAWDTENHFRAMAATGDINKALGVLDRLDAADAALNQH
jgi:hypothetical protein